MTFTAYLQAKYPLYRESLDFKVPLEQIIIDAEAWAAQEFANTVNFSEFWHSTNTFDESYKTDIQPTD